MRHHLQIKKWNIEVGQKCFLKLGRSRTQCVAMVTKLLSSYCGAPSVNSYCKESNIPDAKLAEISFFTLFDQNLVDYMTSSLG